MDHTGELAPRPTKGGRDKTWVAAVVAGAALAAVGVMPHAHHCVAAATAVLCGAVLMAVGLVLRVVRRPVDEARLRQVEEQLFNVDLRLMREEGTVERNSECLHRVVGVLESYADNGQAA